MLYLISIKALRQKVIFKAIGIYKSLPQKVRFSLIADFNASTAYPCFYQAGRRHLNSFRVTSSADKPVQRRVSMY